MYLKAYSQVQFTHTMEDLRPHEGVWQYVNKLDSFTLVLKIDWLYKSQKFRDSTNDKLVLYCWHRYVENGKEVESTLSSMNDLKKSSGLGTTAKDLSTVYLGLMIYDITRDKQFRIFFKFLNKEKTMALWESWPQERVGGSGLIPKISDGQTIPSPILLNKVCN